MQLIIQNSGRHSRSIKPLEGGPINLRSILAERALGQNFDAHQSIISEKLNILCIRRGLAPVNGDEFLGHGFCASLAMYFIYSELLSVINPEGSNIDDAHYFSSIMEKISGWDPRSDLSSSDEKEFLTFLSKLILFSNLENSNFHQFTEGFSVKNMPLTAQDTKGRRLAAKDKMRGQGNLEELSSMLESLKEGKGYFFCGFKHLNACVVKNGVYKYYDANNPLGIEEYSKKDDGKKNLEDLSKKIFEDLRLSDSEQSDFYCYEAFLDDTPSLVSLHEPIVDRPKNIDDFCAFIKSADGVLDVKKLSTDFVSRFGSRDKDRYGHNIYQAACLSRKKEIFDYLLKVSTDREHVFGYEANDFSNFILELCEKGNFGIVDYLLSLQKYYGWAFDANCRNFSGKTILHYVACYGELGEDSLINRITNSVLDAGADINATDDQKITPIMNALEKYASLPYVQFLIEEKNADIRIVSNEGGHAFHFAALGGSREVIEYVGKKMISLGKDPLAPDYYESTPVHFSVCHHYEHSLNAVVNSLGTDVQFSSKDTSGQTVLDVAVKFKNLAAIEDLFQLHNCDASELISELTLQLAVSIKSANIIDYLLDRLSDSDDQKRTKDFEQSKYVLLDACKAGQLEVVKHLIEKYGFDLLLKNIDASTAYHWACFSQDLNLVKFLEERLPPEFLKLTDLHGHNAVDYAFKNNEKKHNANLIEHLSSKGFLINRRMDMDGVVFKATTPFFVKMVRSLLDQAGVRLIGTESQQDDQIKRALEESPLAFINDYGLEDKLGVRKFIFNSEEMAWRKMSDVDKMAHLHFLEGRTLSLGQIFLIHAINGELSNTLAFLKTEKIPINEWVAISLSLPSISMKKIEGLEKYQEAVVGKGFCEPGEINIGIVKAFRSRAYSCKDTGRDVILWANEFLGPMDDREVKSMTFDPDFMRKLDKEFEGSSNSNKPISFDRLMSVYLRPWSGLEKICFSTYDEKFPNLFSTFFEGMSDEQISKKIISLIQPSFDDRSLFDLSSSFVDRYYIKMRIYDYIATGRFHTARTLLANLPPYFRSAIFKDILDSEWMPREVESIFSFFGSELANIDIDKVDIGIDREQCVVNALIRGVDIKHCRVMLDQIVAEMGCPWGYLGRSFNAIIQKLLDAGENDMLRDYRSIDGRNLFQMANDFIQKEPKLKSSQESLEKLRPYNNDLIALSPPVVLSAYRGQSQGASESLVVTVNEEKKRIISTMA